MSNHVPYQPNTCQVPNIIIDYWMHKLSDTQFKVLMVITRKTLGWSKKRDKISKSQIEELTGFKRNAVRLALRDLEELKLIKSFSNKSKDGDSDPNSYQLNMLEIKENIGGLSSEPTGGLAGKPRVGSLESPTKPKTKPTISKGIVLEETLPFSSEKEGNETGMKFPLKKEQKPYLEKMKSLDLGSNDGTLIILIREAFKENKVDLLDKAISHIQAEVEKGTIFKKAKIALFRNVLKGKVSPISENAKNNKKFAEGAKKKGKWESLEIHDKYVICKKTQKEIPLDKPREEFEKMIKSLFDLSRNY